MSGICLVGSNSMSLPSYLVTWPQKDDLQCFSVDMTVLPNVNNCTEAFPEIWFYMTSLLSINQVSFTLVLKTSFFWVWIRHIPSKEAASFWQLTEKISVFIQKKGICCYKNWTHKLFNLSKSPEFQVSYGEFYANNNILLGFEHTKLSHTLKFLCKLRGKS